MDNAFEKGYVPKCANCGGERIWWDAVADWRGELVSVMDYHECSDCGSSRITWVKES